jgi:hypothetical protein
VCVSGTVGLWNCFLNKSISSFIEMFKFEVPSLMVGTLDSLMVRKLAWLFSRHALIHERLSDSFCLHFL